MADVDGLLDLRCATERVSLRCATLDGLSYCHVASCVTTCLSQSFNIWQDLRCKHSEIDAFLLKE